MNAIVYQAFIIMTGKGYDEKALRLYASMELLKHEIEIVCNIPAENWVLDHGQWKTPRQPNGDYYLVVEQEVKGWDNG